MKIRGSVAFVTGGQRGLGAHLTAELLARGAERVYVAVRAPRKAHDDRVIPVHLDVTDFDAIWLAAARCMDVTLVVNNAGIASPGDLLSASTAAIRADFETNFFGAIEVVRAFAPVLAANKGGAILNIHSVLSWATAGDSYSASKAALWSATNGFRGLLKRQGTSVTGLHVAWVDTEMTTATNVQKTDPSVVAKIAIDGVEAGKSEIIADAVTAEVKSWLICDPVKLWVGE